MKILKKLLAFTLALGLSIPTFAATAVEIEDTFTFSNITDTIAVLQNPGTTGLNYYIIAADNTVRACGPSVLGVGSSAVNTGDSWVLLSKSVFGSPIENIVKINGSTANYLTMLDSKGNAWVSSSSSSIPKMIDSEDIRFVDIASLYTKSNGALSSLLVAENGELYLYNSTGLNKLGGFTDVECVQNFCISNSDVVAWVKHKDGSVSFVNAAGTAKQREIEDVVAVYSCNDGVYVRYANEKVAKYYYSNSTIKPIVMPSIGKFANIIGWSGVTGEDYVYLITDERSYIMRNETLVEIDIDITGDAGAIPIAMNRDLVICDNGKTYKCTVSSGVNKVLNEMTEIDMWTNDNPIIMDTDLAHFGIKPNSIQKKGNNYLFNFSLVSKDTPRAFNIYYCTDGKVSDKGSWIPIESEVLADSLSPEPYLTGYVDPTGMPIDGSTYTYTWHLGEQNLTGINIIVEPVYE